MEGSSVVNKNPRGLPVVKLSAENHQFQGLTVLCVLFSNYTSVHVCVVPCVLVAGRKLSMCIHGLLQLFLFGPSAVAKL